MKIRRISLPKALLAQMPASERSFFLLAGHMQNELNSLNKALAWCLHREPSRKSSAIESLANGVQAQIYARLLAGKLFEAWKALKPAYFGAKISHRLEGKLHIDSQEGLKEIKAYFNKPSNIFRVRQLFAFHYSVEEFDANWSEAADEPSFELIAGGTLGNNLSLASELVVNNALLTKTLLRSEASRMRRFLTFISTTYRNEAPFTKSPPTQPLPHSALIPASRATFDNRATSNLICSPKTSGDGLATSWMLRSVKRLISSGCW